SAGAAPAEDEGITYQALLLDRKVDGDFTLEARLQTGADWKISGLIFGARDTDHYEAIVLRNRPGDEKGAGGKALNNVDFGSYDSGAWTFRGDGSIKAEYDAAAGVVLRLDVRGRAVSVSIDGTPVTPIVGGQFAKSIKYPQGALRILDRLGELPPDDGRDGRAVDAHGDRAAAHVETQHDAGRGVVLGLDRAVAAEGPGPRVVAAEVDVVERLAARALLVAGPVA